MVGFGTTISVAKSNLTADRPLWPSRELAFVTQDDLCIQSAYSFRTLTSCAPKVRQWFKPTPNATAQGVPVSEDTSMN